MKPFVVQIDPQNIDVAKIKEAADIINRGGLVVFPTETVYGLGANALDAKAVAGIFSAKKRPLDDPLIVHIAAREDLSRLTLEVPEKARLLTDKFWPGPLTVVLKKSAIVPDIVTTGLDTVAVRMPSGTISAKLIELAGTPIAAPSANLFGKPSPTSVCHVIKDMPDQPEMIIDGGDTEIGIESTVVAFSEEDAIVLRPGGITVEEIEEVIGRPEICPIDLAGENCPGKYPQHYSPDAKVFLVEVGPGQIGAVRNLAENLKAEGYRTGIMCSKENALSYGGHQVKILGPSSDPNICAYRLFRVFREFDSENYERIIVEGIEEKGMGLAVMNRIRKAAGPD
jgi:L-threonylcarbamoyladenylate synthase